MAPARMETERRLMRFVHMTLRQRRARDELLFCFRDDPENGAEIVQFLSEHGFDQIANALAAFAAAHGIDLPLAEENDA